MADISVIKLPSGSEYNIKDAWARQAIEGLGNPTHFLGASSTTITDGGTEKPTINNAEVTPNAGDIVVYSNGEFIWSGTVWIELGDLSGLGALAYKDSASGSVKPTGTVSKPTFTGSSSSVTITATDNTSGNYQPKGTVSQPTFSGSATTSTGKFTPAGSVSQPSFTGTGVRLVTGNISTADSASFTGTEGEVSVSGSYTPAGSVTVGTTTATTTVSAASSGTTTYTPGGSVGTPTISVKTAGSTTTIKNPTSKTVVTDMSVATPAAAQATGELLYYSISGETLTLNKLVETTGDSITTSNVTVKNGDAAYQSSQPSWTGTAVRLVTGNITTPTGSGSFSGTAATISASGDFTPAGSVSLTKTNKTTTVSAASSGTATYTPGGTVSKPTFSGTEGNVSVSGTPSGTVSQPTFTGTKTQLSGTTTAAGSVSQPTFTGDEKTVTVS